MANVPEGILFGMGNPLLDISAVVDQSFLDKYGLEPNNAILAEDKHVPMYQDMVDNFSVEYIAGGATQNSLRVAQWVLKTPHATTFMGGVGTDKFSKTLEESAAGDGVNVQYQKMSDHPTGTCAVLITGTHRSLCAYLGAANHFSIDHLNKPDNSALMEKAKFYYISGFFLTVSPESILKVAKHAAENNKTFMMNLSAPFISQFFTERLNSVVPYIDILFGNETEAVAFSEVQKFGLTDVAEIAQKIVSLPKENTKRSRMVVFTQGADHVIVAQESGIQTFPVKTLTKEQIVDTNGAGDAFVGGFLAQYVQGKPIASCVSCGVWTATEIIQQQGCAFPKDISYVEEN